MTFTDKLLRVTRESSSHSGNPNYLLTFSVGRYRTALDSTLGFEITPSMEGKTFTVLLEHMRVVDLEEVPAP